MTKTAARPWIRTQFTTTHSAKTRLTPLQSSLYPFLPFSSSLQHLSFLNSLPNIPYSNLPWFGLPQTNHPHDWPHNRGAFVQPPAFPFHFRAARCQIPTHTHRKKQDVLHFDIYTSFALILDPVEYNVGYHMLSFVGNFPTRMRLFLRGDRGCGLRCRCGDEKRVKGERQMQNGQGLRRRGLLSLYSSQVLAGRGGRIGSSDVSFLPLCIHTPFVDSCGGKGFSSAHQLGMQQWTLPSGNRYTSSFFWVRLATSFCANERFSFRILVIRRTKMNYDYYINRCFVKPWILQSSS